MNSDALIKKLKKETKDLECQINNMYYYNVKVKIIRTLIKSNLFINKILPFVASFLVFYGIGKYEGNSMFIKDYIKDEPYVEMIETSKGKTIIHTSFDYKYEDSKLEYSTGWIINKNGLFERNSIVYYIDEKVKLEDKDSLLNMTTEDLNKLVITDIYTIIKSELDENDKIYTEDAIVLTTHIIDENASIIREETNWENFWHTTLYIVLSLSWGASIFIINGKVIKKHVISDMLNKNLSKYKILSIKEIENLKKVYEYKKENLLLLTEDVQNDNAFVLRKGLKK